MAGAHLTTFSTVTMTRQNARVNNSGGGSPRTGQPGSGPVDAWVLFLLFGLLIAAHGFYMIVLPSADPDHWRSYTSDPDVVAYLADDFMASIERSIAYIPNSPM